MKLKEILEQVDQMDADGPSDIDKDIKAARMANNRALVALLNRKKTLLQNLNKVQLDIQQLDNQIKVEKEKQAQQQAQAQAMAAQAAMAQATLNQ